MSVTTQWDFRLTPGGGQVYRSPAPGAIRGRIKTSLSRIVRALGLPRGGTINLPPTPVNQSAAFAETLGRCTKTGRAIYLGFARDGLVSEGTGIDMA